MKLKLPCLVSASQSTSLLHCAKFREKWTSDEKLYVIQNIEINNY